MRDYYIYIYILYKYIYISFLKTNIDLSDYKLDFLQTKYLHYRTCSFGVVVKLVQASSQMIPSGGSRQFKDAVPFGASGKGHVSKTEIPVPLLNCYDGCND